MKGFAKVRRYSTRGHLQGISHKTCVAFDRAGSTPGGCCAGPGRTQKIPRDEALSALLNKVQPEYPSVAKQLKIQGTVELEAVVSEPGEVTKIDIVSGKPMLTGPAANAVKRWKFNPFTEDGKAIRVLALVTLDFRL
jgi:TonB family protein